MNVSERSSLPRTRKSSARTCNNRVKVPSRQGRPRPSGRRWGVSKGRRTRHCASVKSILLIYAGFHNSQGANGLNAFMR
jgi:hypothetical protein